MSGFHRLTQDLFAALNPREPEGVRFGRYVLVREIGRGGMGIVHLAWDRDLQRYVALKMLRSEAGEVARKRLYREAQASAALDHPGIVRLFGIGEIEGKAFLELQYVDGPTLSTWLEEHHGTLRDRVRLLCRIAAGVAYAHTRGVIHRDLKPGNILLDSDGEPHIVDFGLATVEDERSRITRTQDRLGTPAYMSPEQVRGERVDHRCDIYALGAMLYFLLTDRLPFEGKTVDEVLAGILRRPPVSPRKRNPKVHADLETICFRALEKDPDHRYPTAEALGTDLQLFLDGEPILARPAGSMVRWVRRIRRHPLPLLVILVLLAVLSTAAAFGVRASQARRRVRQVEMGASRREQATLLMHSAWQQVQEARRELYKARSNREWHRRRWGEAVSRLTRAMESDPTYLEPVYLRGRAYLQLEKLDEAERDFREALKLDPACTRAWSALGVACATRYVMLLLQNSGRRSGMERHEGLLQRAREALAHSEETETLSLDDWVFSQVVRALHANYVAGDSGGARRVLDDALTRYDSEEFHYWKALLLSPFDGAELLEERKKHLQAAVEIMPQFARAWDALGVTLMLQGEAQGAQEALDRATDIDPERPEYYLNAGAARLLARNGPEALARLDRAIQLRPTYVEAYLNRSRTHALLGDRAKALGDCEKVLELDPRYGRAFAARACLRLDGGDWDGCIADCTDALNCGLQSADEGDAWLNRASAYYRRAHATRNRGDLDRALCDVNQVLALDPDRGDGWELRGATRLALGDPTGARADVERAIRLRPAEESTLRARYRAILGSP